MSKMLETILQQECIISLLNEGEKKYMFAQLDLPYDSGSNTQEILRLLFYIMNSIFSNKDEVSLEIKNTPYRLLKTIDISSEEDKAYFDAVFGMDGIDASLVYYFYLASIALIAEKQISIRIDLKEFTQTKEYPENWKDRLLWKTFEAYLYLIRKRDGFSDIKKGLDLINNLQEEQKIYEEKYLNQFSLRDEVEEAYLLLAIYHLSKALVETSLYLLQGYEYKGRLDVIIRQHLDVAKKLSKNNPRLVSVLQLFEFGLNNIY